MSADWKPIAPGVERRVLQDGEQVMLVQAHFVKGALLPEHAHIHEQITFILSGELQFTMQGHTQILSAGASVHIPSNVPHSAIATEATVALDSFSPPREDFRA